MEGRESTIGDKEADKSKEGCFNGFMIDESRKWEDLPPDCLLHVMLKLSLEDRVLNAPYVCKSWFNASVDASYWNGSHFTSRNPSLTMEEWVKLTYATAWLLRRGYL